MYYMSPHPRVCTDYIYSSIVDDQRKMSRSLFNSVKTLHKTHVCKCKALNNEYIYKNRNISFSMQNYLNKSIAENESVNKKDEEHNLPSGLTGKYKIFRDEDAPVIFDVNEEKKRIELNELSIEEDEADPYEGISLDHGVTGVIEIDELVEILRRDNAKQIFVASVPKEFSYVDYIVIVTGKSPRHMLALATFVRKIYKLKKYKHEDVPKIEGEGSKDWMAIDLGNIALHVFSREARKKYDLETLWAVGPEYDDLSNVKDTELDIMDKYSSFLKDLQPAE